MSSLVNNNLLTIKDSTTYGSWEWVEGRGGVRAFKGD